MLIFDESTLNQMIFTVFRGYKSLKLFLFFRLVIPFVGLKLGLLCIFLLGGFADILLFMKLLAFILMTEFYSNDLTGFYLPVIYRPISPPSASSQSSAIIFDDPPNANSQ